MLVPAGTTFVPGSLTCDGGLCTYDAGTNTVTWTGEIPPAGPLARNGGQIDSLTGSFDVFDTSVGGDVCYTPGEAQTFCFRAETFSPDYAYAYNNWLKFPVGWDVDNAYVVGTPWCDNGSWGSFSWTAPFNVNEINISHARYMGSGGAHCIAYYCVDVTTASAGGNALESWYWAGDDYGGPPKHPCSSDGYTPAGQDACDEAINPPAAIPSCEPINPVTIQFDVTAEVCGPVNNLAVIDDPTLPAHKEVTASTQVQCALMTVEPPELVQYLQPEQSNTQTVEVCNVGDLAMNWTVSETGAGLASTGRTDVTLPVDALTIPPASNDPAIADTGVSNGTPAIGTPATDNLPNDIGAAWEVMAPLPSARVFNAVIAEGQYVYVIGGTSDAGGATPTNTNFRYDTLNNTWSTMAVMPAALDSIDGIAIGGMIYIPGSDPDSNTYVYDIATDTWSGIPANGGYAAPVQYQVVAIGTDLYVLGGIVGGATSTPNVWILDTTTGTWSAGVPMQKTRTSFSAAAIGNNIYVAGGVAFPGFAPDMTAEMFDGVAWSYIAAVPNGGGAYTRWSYNADGMAPGALWLAAGRRDAGWAVLNHAGYYDVASDTWTDSPTIPMLNQGRVYMEGDVAADGYFYVIGGRDSAGAITYDTNERLMVFSNAVDVPWLSETPTAGTLDPGACQFVDVTFDSTGLTVSDNFAGLEFSTDGPPMQAVTVPVTLHVVDFTMEKVAPAEAWTGETIPYTITVDFQPNLMGTAMLTDVIPAGTTFVPGSLTCDLGTCSYDAGTNTVSWTNGAPPQSQVTPTTPAAGNPRQVALTLDGNGVGGATAPAPAVPEDAVALVLDDGSRDNDIGLGGTIEMLWVNRFTPNPIEFPFELNQIQIYFSSVGLVNPGDDIVLIIYENTSGSSDPAVGSNYLAAFPTTIQAVDAWNVYDLATPIQFNGPGDVIIGAIGMETRTSYWPASMDQTATQARSWAGWWNASPPPTPPLLPPENWTLIDAYFPGNWMVRGYGETLVVPSQVNISFEVQVTSQGDPVVNTADLVWEGLTGSATATTNVLYPEISLAKTVGTEAGVCATTDQILVLQGTTVYYCYTVTNTGTATFSTHDLVDDVLGELLTGEPIALAPGDTAEFIASAVITSDTTNTATWTAMRMRSTSLKQQTSQP
jgi:uncharacterized repeat protein (TIGR01451 family)